MRLLQLAILACALFCVSAAADVPALPARIDFDRDVQPILSDKCFSCHGPDANKRKAKLRLDTPDGAIADHDGKRAVVPNEPTRSELVARIGSDDPDERMPPIKANRQLSPRDIAILRKWVEQGAPFARHWSLVPPKRPAVPKPNEATAQNEATARNEATGRILNPIDAFILQRLQAEGLRQSPAADKATLIRRVTLDLTGLPPTPAQVDAFLADRSPDAYEKVVDRLLASPAYGERMAWDWLDAARYADSNGYQGDGERTMYPWRDWVIDAFNRNLPYDQFTVWQLAGDLLPEASFEQKLATGFCRNHMINGEGGRIAEENRIEYIFDQLETVGTVWMGMTFNCTRCHDHKFDQLTKRDYYGLFAIFNQTPVNGGGGSPQTPPVLETPTDEQKATLVKLDQQIKEIGEAIDEEERSLFPRPDGKPASASEKAAKLADKARNALKLPAAKRNKTQLAELEKELDKPLPEHAKRLKKFQSLVDQRDGVSKSIVRVMVMADNTPRKTYMLEKGLYDKPGEEVPATIPAAISPALPPGTKIDRPALARWLVSPENPLTARVTVNRFWQQFFGVGLVKTPGDFGVQGERPVNQELLDWLAVEFMGTPASPPALSSPSKAGGDAGVPRPSGDARAPWDVKHLVRLIVTSATYRQSSRVTPELFERDPENRLLARGPRFRMSSWMIRDQALAASGLLVQKVGGPPVKGYQPPGIWEEATFGTKKYVQDHGDALYRRSLYTFWRRIVGPTMFFDAGARQTCTVKVTRTNSPLHALATLNDVTYVEAARVLAERVLKSDAANDGDRIDLAFRLVLARKPAAGEREVLVAAVARLRKQFGDDPAAAKKLLAAGESKRDEKIDPAEHAAWTGVCGAILNLDEALTKE